MPEEKTKIQFAVEDRNRDHLGELVPEGVEVFRVVTWTTDDKRLVCRVLGWGRRRKGQRWEVSFCNWAGKVEKRHADSLPTKRLAVQAILDHWG